MPRPLTYETLEHLHVRRPVDRIDFIADLSRDKIVLDIGCLDETALEKRDTQYWLHGRVVSVAREVIGIDSSAKIPPAGLRTGANAVIVQGNGVDPQVPDGRSGDIEQIVAGEFIEHIEAPIEFFRNMKRQFDGRELVFTTPNGTAFANTLVGLFGREAQHKDHTQIFTYKILNTLCMRAGFKDWEIVPYRFVASEMVLRNHGVKRLFVNAVQSFIRTVEHLFPLLSFGYVVRVRI